MKTFFTLSVLLALSVTVFSGCTTSFDAAMDTMSYPEPNALETQERVQKIHTDALRQDF